MQWEMNHTLLEVPKFWDCYICSWVYYFIWTKKHRPCSPMNLVVFIIQVTTCPRTWANIHSYSCVVGSWSICPVFPKSHDGPVRHLYLKKENIKNLMKSLKHLIQSFIHFYIIRLAIHMTHYTWHIAHDTLHIFYGNFWSECMCV